ncbi:hypothetical protein [Schumannella soli]|uniref:Uncharacterized protein n=1 Tax=Schumannella soli TaxID=2590779 RepID=A0A506Y7E5_9MICO|nr:hypothetical protein [Schumannella soli]TPW77440.1 hypothetical protein FJ657_01785 [Schumannella soli]
MSTNADGRFARTLARREMHRSRSVASSVAAVLAALAVTYAAIELVLAGFRLLPLLVRPADAESAWLTGAPLVLAAAGALVVLGVIALLLAVLSQRRPRHRLDDARSVILVDDDVLASAVSRRLARFAGVAAEQVRTAVGRGSLAVLVRPTSGRPLVQAELDDTAAAFATALAARPRLRSRVTVARDGVVAR